MKFLKSVIPTLVLGLGLAINGCSVNGTVLSSDFPKADAVQSVNFHLVAIQQHKDRVAVLEQKIQKLENRLVALKNKPYRDPKGFKRHGWKKLIGTWRGEIRDISERIVWHANEIERLQALKGMRGLMNG